MSVWAIVKQITLYVKTCQGYFLATFGNNLATFLFNIWSHCSKHLKHYYLYKNETNSFFKCCKCLNGSFRISSWSTIQGQSRD